MITCSSRRDPLGPITDERIRSVRGSGAKGSDGRECSRRLIGKAALSRSLEIPSVPSTFQIFFMVGVRSTSLPLPPPFCVPGPGHSRGSF